MSGREGVVWCCSSHGVANCPACWTHRDRVRWIPRELVPLPVRRTEQRDARLDALSRAEFAESLLCAMAWDHGSALAWAEIQRCEEAPMYLWANYDCPFCDAAREGGR